ncbi:MAG: thioredoxin family protein [Deltaproteobacteria bacterium]|nr:thioredoxin family protein [Deltaproteobacteria bacterium]
MARTPSTMVPLGTPAPAFSLPDTASDRVVSLADHAGAPALLVMFLCNHCPFVVHVRPRLVELVEGWQARGVAVVAISSNDPVGYPADAPERMAEDARRFGFTFPYLFDATQEVALRYHAACTPDFFLYDRERRLAYRGQLDASRPGNGVEVTGADLERAIEAVLAGRAPDPEQRPSLGCNIKWRAENMANGMPAYSD